MVSPLYGSAAARLFAICLVFLSYTVTYHSCFAGNSPDLPNPSPNIISISEGSIVIPMDDLQNNCDDDSFNLKAYGFVVHLLYREIPVYWAIAAGKHHDDSDFSALASEVFPNCGQSEETCFSGGPFIVPSEYSDAVLDFAEDWLCGDHDVVLYQLDQDVDVDIRHFLYQKPRILIADADDPCLHVEVFEEAGLEAGVHFVVIQCPEDIEDVDCNSCYTLITVPKAGEDYDISAGYPAIDSFVYSGGNFLAQDSAIEAYENYDGGFLTANGICPYNTGNERLLYPNADLPYGQFIGHFPGDVRGNVSDWCVNPGGWKNNGYEQVINDPDAFTCADGSTTIIAAAGKVDDGDFLGGMIFYLGGSEWNEPCPEFEAGKRLILNAALTPSVRPDSCGLDFCPAEVCGCDEDCPPGQWCVEGLCTEPGGCCEADTDCPSFQACINNNCTDVGFCCEVNGDCPSGQVCVEGACSGTGPCGSEGATCCQNNYDCPSGETCFEGTCVPTGPCAVEGATCCQSDSDCGACETCSHGICTAMAYCCKEDSDCGPGCKCNNTVCYCNKDGTAGGGLTGVGDGDGDGKTAAIVGGTVGGLVGLAGLAGLAMLAVAAGVLLFRYFKTGATPGGITSALDVGGGGNSNVNPLHTPQEASVVNPLYSDI